MRLKRCARATGIGSLPYMDAGKATDFVVQALKGHIPFWPQLPKRSFLESMHVQYTQGLPGLCVDENKKSLVVNTQEEHFISEFEQCFLAIDTKDLSYFAMGQDYASGFYSFKDAITHRKLSCVKGQVVGPITLSMMLTDQEKKPIVFNPEFFGIVDSFLGCKAQWQINELRAAGAAEVTIFIDEPYLVAIGTNQFASIERSEIIKKINTVVSLIHEAGALAGIHCCGNTDWGICLATDIDILSFDAFEFLDSLFIYKNELQQFVARGGVLACGIVPNKQDYPLENYLETAVEALHAHPLLLKNGVLITPSCGCGSIAVPFAEKVHQISVDIADGLSPLYETST